MTWPQYMLDAGGPAASQIAGLGWWALITLIVAGVGTFIILLVALFRRPGSLSEHAPVDAEGGQRWIIVGGVIVPALVVGGLFIGTLAKMSAFPLHEVAMTPQVDIHVIGHQWWFEAIYQGTGPSEQFRVPTEIHIPVGKPVTISLTTNDVIHSFWVPKLHGKVDLIPGRVNYIQIEASEPGVYRGQCAEYCGMQHAHMIIEVVAESPDQYAAWVARQLQPADPPDTAQRAEGQQLFQRNACVACHPVRGTAAMSGFAPDLTHVGSRRLIAGGMLENDTANMAAWVTHAQSLKPGVIMPNVSAFTGPELHALVAYLRGLK